MTAKRTVAKKSASKKPAAKKVAVKKSVPAKRDPDTVPDPGANEQAKMTGDASKMPRPKIHAKVVSIQVSIGTDDRNRSVEDFIKEIEKRLRPVKYGEKGLHASISGGHYILDGKVCLPEDYNPKTQNFKPGATPPSWAGGPTHKPSAGVSATQQQMIHDARTLSRDEYDKKYKIGKYRQLGSPNAILITPEMQKQKREDGRKAKLRAEEEALEELDFDWDEDDVNDDTKLGKVADESASAAIKKLKGKRVVVKKKPATPAKKKVVKRVKK